MTRSGSQFWLAGLFLCGLILAEVAVAFAYAQGPISAADIETLSITLLTTYSVPLAVVVAGIFSNGPAENAHRALSAAAKRKARFAAWLAIVWNILVLWRVVVFVARVQNPAFDDPQEVANLVHYVDMVSKGSSFLIAAALVWLFGETTKAP